MKTFDKYLEYANNYYERHKEWQRYGQALYNALTFFNEDYGINIANKIVDTDIDCYYNDSKIPYFLEFVKSKME